MKMKYTTGKYVIIYKILTVHCNELILYHRHNTGAVELVVLVVL